MIWNKGIMVGLGAFATAMFAAMGIDIYEHRKLTRKIGIAAGELKAASVKDIQQGIVEKAVKDASEERVESYVREIKRDILNEAREKLGAEAKKAVSEAGDIVKKEVGDRISKEASMIDMGELKTSARNAAEAKILEKFDGNLEDLLEKFNDNLSNVQKIYGGIADAISKTNEKSNGLKFTIGS